MIALLPEIGCRNIKQLRQAFCSLLWNTMCSPFLHALICANAYTDEPCHFRLHQPFTVPAPAKPVRYIVDLLVAAIPLIELGSFQNFTRGAQYKTMYK